MHRFVLFCVIGLALGVEAVAQTLPGEAGTARLNGVYTSLSARDAAACARACSADGLCQAWTYAANGCALTAIAAPPTPAPGARSGLSARAPAFARTVSYAPPPLPPTPAPPANVTLRGALAPSNEGSDPFANAAADELLGGPEEPAQPTR